MPTMNEVFPINQEYVPSFVRFMGTGLKPSEDFELTMDVPGAERRFVGRDYESEGQTVSYEAWKHLEISNPDESPFSAKLEKPKFLYVGHIRGEHGKAWTIILGRSEFDTLLIGSLYYDLYPDVNQQPMIMIGTPDFVSSNLLSAELPVSKTLMESLVKIPYGDGFVSTGVSPTKDFQVKMATTDGDSERSLGNFVGFDGRQKQANAFAIWSHLEPIQENLSILDNYREHTKILDIGNLLSEHGKIYMVAIGRNEDNELLIGTTFYGDAQICIEE